MGSILANYGLEDTTRSLRERYGEVPRGWGSRAEEGEARAAEEKAAQAAAAAAAAERALVEREGAMAVAQQQALADFYQKHNPEKVGGEDLTLTALPLRKGTTLRRWKAKT